MAEYDDMFISLREHKVYAAWNPNITFAHTAGTIRILSDTPGLGKGYNFICFPRWYLSGKYIKFRWRVVFENAGGAGGPWTLHKVLLYDGTYDRSSNVDFPSGAEKLLKGNGLVQAIYEKQIFGPASPIDITETVGPLAIDPSGGSLDEMTIFFQITDGWASQYVIMYIDWIQICNSDASIIYWEQDCNGAVTMEQTGTFGDYGYYGNLNPCGTLIQPCGDFDNQIDCEAHDCCWCEVDGVWQCVDCPCPPLWKHDEVGLKGDEDCIIDYILGWDEEEEVPIPIKRIVRKDSPTTQAEYSSRFPRVINLEGMCTKTHRDCLEDLKHTHQWLRLYDSYESLIDYVWLEALSSRWAGDEDKNYPWNINLTLICSTT